MTQGVSDDVNLSIEVKLNWEPINSIWVWSN